VEFYRRWRIAILNEERLKREAITFQFESLKNQVNPHFLFNSLNVLTTLITKDAESSIRFVKQLSEVYRYVLDQNTKDITWLAEELQFLNSYIYLNKIRFNESFNVEINIVDQDFQIIPLALQMLLENAIKHNIISEEKPLLVKIYDTGDYLVVENNLQKKSTMFDSNQIGLKNIQFRYEFLTRKKMEVTSDDSKFVVKLPKIKTSLHENINS
jgi:LytS/YehU family sensor histidine kinase